jgi:SAM-dependent methyltransferase
MPLNDFSDVWLSAFLGRRDAEETKREAQFVSALLGPNSRVLDVPCGYGRHAAVLASFGHEVVGLDRDPRMLSRARRVCTAVQAEMRQLPFGPGSFDAAVNLWQSFGYFSQTENAAVLKELARTVRPRGLLVLDLYTRGFYETVLGERRFVRGGVTVQERTILRDDRVNVKLIYDGLEGTDEFEWQVFSPRELEALGSASGWQLAGQFTEFNPDRPAADEAARVQYVFRKATTSEC